MLFHICWMCQEVICQCCVYSLLQCPQVARNIVFAELKLEYDRKICSRHAASFILDQYLTIRDPVNLK